MDQDEELRHYSIIMTWTVLCTFHSTYQISKILKECGLSISGHSWADLLHPRDGKAADWMAVFLIWSQLAVASNSLCEEYTLWPYWGTNWNWTTVRLSKEDF